MGIRTKMTEAKKLKLGYRLGACKNQPLKCLKRPDLIFISIGGLFHASMMKIWMHLIRSRRYGVAGGVLDAGISGSWITNCGGCEEIAELTIRVRA